MRQFRVLIALFMFSLPVSLAYTQDIVLPTTVDHDETVIIDLSMTFGDDPKFDVSPKPLTFRVLKDFNGNAVALLVPGKQNAGKTLAIAYADNVKGKTKLAVKTVAVNPLVPVPPGPTPVPPGPTPTPVNNKYFLDLKGAYLVNPAPDKLDILTSIYKEVGLSGFNKRSDAAKVLASLTSRKLQPTDLRTVRDKVKDFLERDIGTDDSAPFEQTKFSTFFGDIVGALEAVKQGK